MTTKAVTRVNEFGKTLALHEKQFASVLPAHIPPKKFMRTVMGAIQNNPKILDCDRNSLMASCQKAAQDGLVLDGREAALVMFGKQATYMPMVTGLLKKLRNSGQISTITAQTVHEMDAFKYNPAMDDVPNHNPDWFGKRGKIIGVYAVAKMNDGGVVVEVMNLEQIDKVRKVSRSGDKGPWKDWFDEMAKKTVLRRIAKYLPSSADVDLMLEHDNENYDLDAEPEAKPAAKKKVSKKTSKKTRAASVIEGEVVDTPKEDEFDEQNPPPIGDDEGEGDPI